MYKFLYVVLACGLISGAGVFLHIPKYPSLIFPMLVALLGILSTLITIPNKEISGMLKLGGILINIMPLLGSFTMINS